MYLFVFAFVVMGACIAGWAIANYTNVRKTELEDVQNWFSDQLRTVPLRPLSPENTAVVENIMSEDGDLWFHLGRGIKHIDHAPYYQVVTQFGRYLNVLGSSTHPSIYYGVFDDNNVPVLRPWIEFRHPDCRSGTVWVLFEDLNNSTASPQITSFSDFRVTHPGLIHRHAVYFLPSRKATDTTG